MMKSAPVPARLPITSCPSCRQSFRPQRPDQRRCLTCDNAPETNRPDIIMQPRGPGRPPGAKNKGEREGVRKLWIYPDRTPKGKRICRRCGEDPKPNMFYCPACLSVVSDYVDDQFAVL